MRPRLLASAFLCLALPLSAATFTVNSNDDADDGTCNAAHCSLREAINAANAAAGADLIAFDIAGAGVHTIQPASFLPNITDALTIDGYTQPGTSENTDAIATNAVLLIEIDGSLAPPSFQRGLRLNTAGTIRGLVIGGFASGTGIDMSGSGPRTVAGCFLGTDASGSVAHPNVTGVETVSDVTVGGTAPADRNLISGNSFEGIDSPTTTGVFILGNLIGTDATGQLAIPNGNGIHFNGIPSVTIGGSGPGAGNVISGNSSFGISGGHNCVVQGNRIGTTADGTGPLPNGGAGIAPGSNNAIGGTGPGEGNLIAYNGTWGFADGQFGNFGVGNTIRGNSIHDNGNLGIDLGVSGPTANDPQDPDTGANGLQNFPIIQSVELLGPVGDLSTRILGKLNSTPSTTFDLDFYSNSVCSNFPRELIEGEAYLGSAQVTTDGNGDAAIDVTLAVATEVGARISATATDPAGNTSEFSQRILFSITPVSGPAAGGTAFTVTGTDFANPTTLTVGGVPATGVTFTNDHALSAVMPALAPGSSNDVVATTPDGTTGILIKGWVADFLDVPPSHIFHSYVVTLVSNGITAGIGGGLYGVDQGTKRQQMAVFLLKAKNGLCYTPPPCTGTFPDVPCPSTFANWIEELAAQGITTGCGGGLFCPQNLVTRRQMAVFLLKTKYGSGYVPPACTGVYDDVVCPTAAAVDFIEELAAEQITGGCQASPPLYCPDNSSTRGQMAVFITKTFNLQ
jgi:CSLREA domain-containing protein